MKKLYGALLFAAILLSGPICEANDEERAAQMAKTHKSYAVFEKGMELGLVATDAVGAMYALGSRVGPEALCQLPYKTADDALIQNISALPVVIMTGKQTKINALKDFAGKDGVITVAKDIVVGAFGELESLKPLTKSFSVFKGEGQLPGLSLPMQAPQKEICIAAVSDTLEPGFGLNALAHMALGLGAHHTKDADMPSMVVGTVAPSKLTADFWAELKGLDLPGGNLTGFLDTMHMGPTYQEQIAATAQLPLAEHKFLGVALRASLGTALTILKKLA